MQRSVGYTLVFATLVCVICAVIVSSSAVSLRQRQNFNAALEKRRNVLVAAGLAEEGERLALDEIEKRFENMEPVVIDLQTGEELPDVNPLSFDQQKAAKDPQTSRPAPRNSAQVQRLPNQALIYKLKDDQGTLEAVILPIEGKGLWSTLYGFLALDADLNTIRGITFYEHKETPGLGGEVDNPRWKSLWPGRKIYGEDQEPRIEVIKGRAGSPEEEPYRVDGLSGATMTSRGVTNLVRFWLGEHGFGPYIQQLKERGREA